MLSAQQLLTLDEGEIRARLLWIEELDGVSDADKLETYRGLEHVLRAVMLVVAGRMGIRPAAG
jgi:hypothetical protein